MPFTVTSERTVAAVALTNTWCEVGGRIAGSVELAGEPLPGESLVVRLIDRRGRILAEQEPDADGFDFATEPWMPMLLRVEAVLRDAKGPVSSAHAYFRLTTRNRGRFNFLVWDYPKGSLAPYAEQALADLGMTLQLSGGAPPLYVAAHDVAWVPYTTRIMNPHNENGTMQPVCWNDDAAAEAYVRGIAENYAAAREHGVFVYSLGDETVTRGSCVHPACLAAYREYLAGIYGSIEALNESWGSEYASFDEVELLDPTDYKAAEALRQKQYPRWFDRQAFECFNFVGFCTRFAQEYSAMDPEALTGFEGAGRFDRGDDFDLIVRTNGFWSPYPGIGDELIRSIADRDFPRSNWMGYTKDADSLLSKYWRMVTRGMDAVWWWRWDNIGRFHGLLTPHLGPYPAIKELMEDTQVVRDGLGDALLASEMDDDGIAILYSHPSAYANQVESGATYGSYEAAHTGWHKAIRDLGLQFGYVTDRMLRLGEFDARRYRVLILPQAEALGDEEAEAIRDFVQRGGHVIADVRPGIYDGHLKPREGGCLDDLFGIERTGVGDATTETMELRPGFRRPGLTLEGVKVDPAVSAAGAAAAGEAGGHPVFLRTPAAEGQATLLNVSMGALPGIGAEGTPEALAQVLARLFEAAEVEPEIRVTNEGGKRLRNMETIRWRNGALEIVALYREAGEQGRAVMQLPGERFVYDLRARKLHESTARLTVPIRPGRASFFVLSRRPLEAPDLLLRPKACARGDVATLRVTTPDRIGERPFNITVTLPDGSEADWVGGPVVADRNGVRTPIPTALNDPTGTWRITVTDVFTNETHTTELEVE